MPSIKAILIDVEAKEIKEIILESEEGKELDPIYKALKCNIITSAEQHFFYNVGHTLYVDDEGLLIENKIGAFQVQEGQVLSGNGIIVGVDDETGKDIDHFMKLDVLKAFIHFREIEDLPEPTFTFIAG